jgi:hypothetical protein
MFKINNSLVAGGFLSVWVEKKLKLQKRVADREDGGFVDTGSWNAHPVTWRNPGVGL